TKEETREVGAHLPPAFFGRGSPPAARPAAKNQQHPKQKADPDQVPPQPDASEDSEVLVLEERPAGQDVQAPHGRRRTLSPGLQAAGIQPGGNVGLPV